jgi:putative glutamine amidotransferase
MKPRPLIGCATYRKQADQTPPIEVIGLMPTYIEAVRAGGGLPVLIPLGLAEDELDAILDRVDGVLLPGGGDIAPDAYGGDAGDVSIRDVDIDRDSTEFLLIRRSLQQEKPLLAICRGHQVFNVALGGSLWEDVERNMPGAQPHDFFHLHDREYLAHPVEVVPDSRLAEAIGREPLHVNSLHHQGIRRLAPPLRAVAMAPDGLIEGVEVPEHPFAVGVQWHPENMLQKEPRMHALFRRFVQSASNGHH